MPGSAAPGAAPRRLRSVDALRGLTVAAMLLVNDPGDWAHVPPWLEHSLWNGCTFADCIFPFFLFIVGVLLSLSLAPIPAKAPGRRAPLRKILRRGVRIVLLGLLPEATCWLLIADGHAYRPFGSCSAPASATRPPDSSSLFCRARGVTGC